MRVLIEIGHPAHVHFYLRVVRSLEAEGHEVLLVTRNKEITNELLDGFGLEYQTLSAPAKTKLGLLGELLLRWFRVWRILGRRQVDVTTSISGISTALPSWLRRIPSITFTDTEDARLTNLIAFPFSTQVVTPAFFRGDLGPKHVRYEGLHELAYLRDFQPEGLEERLKELGIEAPYFLLRCVAHDAVHDWRLSSVLQGRVLDLVRLLEARAPVHISSQGPLPDELAGYGIDIPVTRMHDVMSGALAYIGESPTMAVESGLLGTPSLLLSRRFSVLGNLVGLEKKEIVMNFDDFSDVEAFLAEVDFDALRSRTQVRAREYLEMADDVTGFTLGLLKSPRGGVDGT